MKTRDFIHVPYYNYNIGMNVYDHKRCKINIIILISNQSVIVIIAIF